MTGAYFQRGFGLKEEVGPRLQAVKESDYSLRLGDLTFLLAREFGFCYGVERAVEYAYEARNRFPDRLIYLTGEIIHNPHVNQRLREMGIRFLRESDGDGPGLAAVRAEDVVIIPAFGVTVQEMQSLRDRGCVLVDTTCGSVLNVWKNVDRFSASGFTAVIHGKYAHEETRATASRTMRSPGGRYLVVRNLEEADVVCGYIRGQGDRTAFLARLAPACSEGFDPDRHLERVGLANQTTMLSSESLDIQERIRRALADRYGEEDLPQRFRAFDTICSATQDRQDAILALAATTAATRRTSPRWRPARSPASTSRTRRASSLRGASGTDPTAPPKRSRHPTGSPEARSRSGSRPARPPPTTRSARSSRPSRPCGACRWTDRGS